MQINTTRFGTIEIDENKIIVFFEGLPGFAGARRFIVLPHKPASGADSPFKWLQCVDEPALALPVMNPWLADPNYSPTIPGVALAKLGITSIGTQSRIWAVVTIPRNDPEHATVNMVAPVLINKETRRALQVVLQQERFSLRTPLTDRTSGAGVCEPVCAVA
jgi:flagellar assembly factor FliW